MSSEIVIVGGSLAGLTLALACAARGVPVRIIERSDARRQGGDSLSIDLADIFEATGHDPRAAPILPAVHAYRDRSLTTWPALYGWLRERVTVTSGIVLDEGRIVAAVEDLGDRAHLVFDDGTQEVVAAVVGADGYRSVVRRTVAPEAPFASYAGYLVWRGLVEEAALMQPVPWPSNGGLWIDFVSGYRLVAGVLPGRDGSVEIGHRQITFAWFDAYREQLLRRAGCLSPESHVIGTLAASAIGPAIRADLSELVPRLWPSPWTEAVQVGVSSASSLSGATIAEYTPAKLARGALAIVGDAAHCVSPMTGRGFASGVEDASLLASLLSDRSAKETVSTVFARYEERRLPVVRSLVSTSQRLSVELVRYAAGFQA